MQFDRLPYMNPTAIDDFSSWIAMFTQRGVLVELGALVLCVLVAWGLVNSLRRALEMADEPSIWFGRKVFDGVLFPAVLLGLVYVARTVVLKFYPHALFKLAIPTLISLVVIRVGVKVLQAAFQEKPWVRLVERSISWLAWVAMVLWVSGLLPLVLNEMEQVSWKVGSSTLTLRHLVEGALTAGAVLIVTLWISAAIESRLLRSATGGQLSLRKALSNATRAVLMTVGVMMALSAVVSTSPPCRCWVVPSVWVSAWACKSWRPTT